MKYIQFTDYTLVYVWSNRDNKSQHTKNTKFLNKIQKNYKKLHIFNINFNKSTSICKKYKITNTPTIILFIKGDIIEYQVGNITEETILKLLKHCIK